MADKIELISGVVRRQALRSRSETPLQALAAKFIKFTVIGGGSV
jgi:hypothetical protein